MLAIDTASPDAGPANTDTTITGREPERYGLFQFDKVQGVAAEERTMSRHQAAAVEIPRRRDFNAEAVKPRSERAGRTSCALASSTAWSRSRR